MDRRTFLGSGLAVALAGCLGGTGGGGDGGGSDGGDGTPTATTMMNDATQTATATPTGESLENHPAAQGLDAQPRLGPDPFDAPATIITFEDPSCPRCAAFERSTVPKIRSELVDTGQAAYVFRVYPVIYQWGKPATQALESTFARSSEAFWALSHHYFENQSSFGTDNVLTKTGEFLAANTDVDAEAVVADAEAKAHDDQVQLDLTAGQNAGAGRTTPTVFLFKDGRYQTKAAGSVSFSVVKNALGL